MKRIVIVLAAVAAVSVPAAASAAAVPPAAPGHACQFTLAGIGVEHCHPGPAR